MTFDRLWEMGIAWGMNGTDKITKVCKDLKIAKRVISKSGKLFKGTGHVFWQPGYG